MTLHYDPQTGLYTIDGRDYDLEAAIGVLLGRGLDSETALEALQQAVAAARPAPTAEQVRHPSTADVHGLLVQIAEAAEELMPLLEIYASSGCPEEVRQQITAELCGIGRMAGRSVRHVAGMRQRAEAMEPLLEQIRALPEVER